MAAKKPRHVDSPPWTTLLYNYSQDSTCHGVRYITHESRYRLRRVTWACLVLTSISFFLYVFITRLIYALKFPKSVNVEIIYENDMTFPAVTLCNQNPYRLTTIHDKGLYDTFQQKYTSKREQEVEQNVTGCVGQLVRSTSIPRCIPMSAVTSIKMSKKYSEVAMSGCRRLCQKLHDETCSRIFFFPLNRTCILTPRTEVPKKKTKNKMDDCQPAIVFERERCLGESKFHCDFEDGIPCDLKNDITGDELWVEVQAELYQVKGPNDARQSKQSTVTSVKGKDHTTDSKKGRIIHLPSGQRQRKSMARMTTEYKNTTGHCMELYYILMPIEKPGKIRISVRGEDYTRHPVLSIRTGTNRWKRKFFKLPNRVNQIIIDSIMTPGAVRSAAIDDITVAPCNEFRSECKRYKHGDDYSGTTTISEDGIQCKEWEDISLYPLLKTSFGLTNKTNVDEWSNYCHYISKWNNIYCLNNSTPPFFHLCNISYCECPSHMRACKDGLCLPKSFFCDGDPDCVDRYDEVDSCASEIKVDCNFATPFICGYDVHNQDSLDVSWKRQQDERENGHMKMIGSMTKGLKATMLSPSTRQQKKFCLQVKYDLGDSQKAAELRVYQRIGLITRVSIFMDKATKSFQTKDVSITLRGLRDEFSFEFEGKIGGSNSSIAIRGVQLTSGACSKSSALEPPALIPNQCQPNGDNCEQEITCNFSKDKCGFQTFGNYDNFGFEVVPKGDFEQNSGDSRDCVQNFTAQTGKIVSPDYPKEYQPYLRCHYYITAPLGGVIKVKFQDFDLEDADECRYDILQVTDFKTIDEKYCGSNLPPIFETDNGQFHLYFRTDGSLQLRGFKITYSITGNVPPPNEANVLAAAMIGENPYPNSMLYLAAPIVQTDEVKCFKFTYYSRSGLQLQREDLLESKTELIWSSTVDTGPTWNNVAIDIQPGRYALKWSARYGFDDVPQATWPPIERYVMALADLSMDRTSCQPKLPDKASLECDFSSPEICDYEPVPGQYTWNRISRNQGSSQPNYFLATEVSVIPATIKSPPFISDDSQKCLQTKIYARVQGGTSSLNFNVEMKTDKGKFEYPLTAYLTGNTIMDVSVPLPQSTNNQVFQITIEVTQNMIGVTTTAYMYPISTTAKLCKASVYNLINVAKPGFKTTFGKWTNLNTCISGSSNSGNYPSDCNSDDQSGTSTPWPAFSSSDYDNSYDYTSSFYSSYGSASNSFSGSYTPSSYPSYESDSMSYGSAWNLIGGSYSGSDGTALTSSPNIRRRRAANDIPQDTTQGSLLTELSTDTTEVPLSTTQVLLSSTGSNQSPRLNESASDQGGQSPNQDQDEEDDAGDLLHNQDENEKLEPFYLNLPESTIAFGEAAIANMSKFTREAGHQLHDAVYECYWNGQICNHELTEVVFTDMGQCITFNNLTKYSTNRTGSVFGLSLKINIEQYEYIKGPNPDAGVKVIMHNHTDIPHMTELAFAIAPGQHAHVDIALSTSANLAPRFGSCGEASSKMFNTSVYTHSRCRRECQMEHHLKHCNCLLPHMLTGEYRECDLKQFLNCSVPLQFDEGYRLTNCHCPIACKGASYMPAMSYAGLSAFSITRLLRSNTTHLKRSYRKANELRQRVDMENLIKTISRLTKIPRKLKEYKFVLENELEGTLQRVKEAVLEIYDMVQDDLMTLGRQLNPYQKAFNETYKSCLDQYRYTVHDRQELFRFYSQYMQIETDQNIPVPTELKEAIDLVLFNKPCFEKLKQLENDQNYIPSLNESWSAKEYASCSNAQSKLLGVLEEVIRDMKYSNGVAKSLNNLVDNITDASRCIFAYESSLIEAAKAIDRARQTVANKKTLIKGVVIELSLLLRNELDQLEANKTFYDALDGRYSEFKISKLELGKYINQRQLTSHRLLFNHIDAKANSQVINLVDSLLVLEAREIKETYASVLNRYVQVIRHFNRRISLNIAVSQCNMWRCPKPTLDVSPILHYQFQTEEQGSYWPSSRSVISFVEDGQAISKIDITTLTYIQTLSAAVYTTVLQVSKIQQELLNILEETVFDLEDFGNTNELDAEFVRNNFMTIDIYYSALRFTSVEQLKAYTFMTFFSEIGGYMGLLLGCSVLTICEFLDVIINNLSMKMEDEHHRRTCTDPNDEKYIHKSKQPPPSYSRSQMLYTPHT